LMPRSRTRYLVNSGRPPYRITEAHDGRLTLTPRPAGGLRVTVDLPAAGRPATT
jgi:hypothetical protein